MDIDRLLSTPISETNTAERDQCPDQSQVAQPEHRDPRLDVQNTRLQPVAQTPPRRSTLAKSAAVPPPTMFQFVDGSAAPKSARDRELAISQRRSFAAKNAHNRRRIQAMAPQTYFVEAPQQQAQFKVESSIPIAPVFQRNSPDIHTPLSTSARESRDTRSPISPMSLQAILSPVDDDEATGKDATMKIDSRTRTELVQRNRRYPSDLLVKILRPPSDQVQSAFKHEDDRRTFDYWRAKPAVEVTRYQMKYAHYWLEVFPRFAVTSETIGHMILAAGYAHESILLTSESQKQSLSAIGHYRKGLQKMAKSSNHLSELELLTAAFFAFTYEERQQNHKGALIHLKGCEAMCKQASPGDSSDLKDLKEYINFILMCILMSTEKHAQEQDLSQETSAKSTKEILDDIGKLRDDLLEQLALVVRLNQHADAHQIRAMHTDWFTLLRQAERSNLETLNRNALFLLSNLFMGLCPPSFYGASSYAEDANNWQGGLDTARLYLTPQYQHDHHMLDELDLLTTIEILAVHLARYVPVSSCREQAEALLHNIVQRRDILNIKIKIEPQ